MKFIYQDLLNFLKEQPSKEDLSKMWILRKILMPMGATDSMEFLLEKIKNSKNNGDFFESMNS